MSEDNIQSFVVDRTSDDGKWITVFEDDGQVAYLYLCSCDNSGNMSKIVDDLWIYNKIDPPIEACKEVFIIWSDDSKRTGLIVDGECWGIYDLASGRKINAPRRDNVIRSLDRSIWDNGIQQNDGNPIKFK